MWKQLNEANFDTSHVIIRGDFQSSKRDSPKKESEGTFHDEKKGDLLASYDTPIWAGGCLEAR
jgi:hypothetical protein